jgi:hypothetical protein
MKFETESNKDKFIFLSIFLLAGILFLSWIFKDPSTTDSKAAVIHEENKLTRSKGLDPNEGTSYWMDPTNWKPDFLKLEKEIHESEVATPKILFTDFKLTYRYPADSRPLTRKMVDLLDPFRIQQEKTPIFRAGTETGEIHGYFTWNSNSYMVTEESPAITWLEVFDHESGNQVRPRILSAEVYSDPIYGEKLIGNVDYNDSGSGFDATSGDGVYTFSFLPRASDRLHWGELTMRVKFDVPEIKMKEAEASFTFHSTPEPPAKFTGKYGEYLENGSLYITVDVDVFRAGQYIFEGNLFDKETGNPYHWVYLRPYLEKGKGQTIRMQFFGAIFHDMGFDEGRFVLKNLRGHRLNLPYDPRKLDSMLEKGQEIPDSSEHLQEWMSLPETNYVTLRSYSLEQFSKQEYNGPDKEARLKVIREYAADWVRLHGAGPESDLED